VWGRLGRDLLLADPSILSAVTPFLWINSQLPTGAHKCAMKVPCPWTLPISEIFMPRHLDVSSD